MPCRQNTGLARRAFTLVEIMVVIVIIGLLAGAVTLNVRGYLNKAKRDTARADIATIAQAVESFYAAYGRYPTNDEGLAVLTTPGEKLPDPLLSSVPRDPWDRPYQYNCPGATSAFEVICYGADGREGGEGIDTDITSDKLKEYARRG